MQNVIQGNIEKWQTLPAGAHRKKVTELMEMTDNELLNFYTGCITFWEKERGWEYKRYSEVFKNRSVLEIGSGLGYDGIIYSKYVSKWTFADIIPVNIEFVKRITGLLKIKNVEYQLVEDIFNHNFADMFDAFYAHGVLHHVPFETAIKEFNNIDRYLKNKSVLVFLMYPYERWVMCGKPDFSEFGCLTDGENTPWAEYYDEKKIVELVGGKYSLNDTTKWGHDNSEFVNFELTNIE